MLSPCTIYCLILLSYICPYINLLPIYNTGILWNLAIQLQQKTESPRIKIKNHVPVLAQTYQGNRPAKTPQELESQSKLAT